jgi:hypothetical protein
VLQSREIHFCTGRLEFVKTWEGPRRRTQEQLLGTSTSTLFLSSIRNYTVGFRWILCSRLRDERVMRTCRGSRRLIQCSVFVDKFSLIYSAVALRVRIQARIVRGKSHLHLPHSSHQALSIIYIRLHLTQDCNHTVVVFSSDAIDSFVRQ